MHLKVRAANPFQYISLTLCGSAHLNVEAGQALDVHDVKRQDTHVAPILRQKKAAMSTASLRKPLCQTQAIEPTSPLRRRGKTSQSQRPKRYSMSTSVLLLRT